MADLPAPLARISPSTQTGQAVRSLAKSRSGALAKLRDMRAKEPMKQATSMLVSVGTAAALGATDAAMGETRLPGGLAPSQLVGVTTAIATLYGAATGNGDLVKMTAPIATAAVSVTAYSYGARAFSNVQSAMDQEG